MSGAKGGSGRWGRGITPSTQTLEQPDPEDGKSTQQVLVRPYWAWTADRRTGSRASCSWERGSCPLRVFAPVPGRRPGARTALSRPRFAGFFYLKMFNFLECLKTKSDLEIVLLSVAVGGGKRWGE